MFLVLRRYLIGLNTTNSIQPIHPIKLNLWCFLFVWCNFYRFNLFWCKNIKIFVFCARINLKGVDTTEIGCRILIIPTRKHALLLVLVKVLYRSSPTPLITVRTPTSHSNSPTWTSIKHCVISFALFDAR